jgi:hypothetical protein
MKRILSLALFATIVVNGTYLVSQTGMPAVPKVIDTGKAPTVKDPTSLLGDITKGTKSLTSTVSKAVSSGALDKTKGTELLSSLKGLQGSADGLYKGVKGGKNLMSMTGDVKTLMSHANKVDKLVGGVPGLRDVTSSWNGLEGQINSLSKLAGL